MIAHGIYKPITSSLQLHYIFHDFAGLLRTKRYH